MPKPRPIAPESVGAFTADFEALVRRHDPDWTGAATGDPGVTLVELVSWLGDSLLGSTARGFPTNASRHDPYKNFKFRVQWDGAYVPGIRRVSGLSRVVQAAEYREGAEPNIVHRAPGAVAYEPITLERGISHDTAFEDWAKLVKPSTPGAGGGYGSHLKTVRIEILNDAGEPAIAYDVYHCWPTVYRPLPDLVDGGPMRLVETITLVHDGWERDPEVVFPT
jgi:phage tail-like protein